MNSTRKKTQPQRTLDPVLSTAVVAACSGAAPVRFCDGVVEEEEGTGSGLAHLQSSLVLSWTKPLLVSFSSEPLGAEGNITKWEQLDPVQQNRLDVQDE